jgi:drug/metabolite transporter (DMT)-like permease
MKVNTKNPYFLLTILAIIWGSSFILMKEGLKTFSSYEVAAFRILLAGLSLLPFVKWRKLEIKKGDFKYFALSGILGSGIPAFLFTAAQTKISSSLAGALNSLTPIFTLLVGVLFLGVPFRKLNLLGALIGILGAFFLIFQKGVHFEFQHALLVVLATLFYGINVNLIKHKLQHYPSLVLAALPLAIIAVGGLSILIFLQPRLHIADFQTIKSISAIALLSIVGTAISLVLFNQLIQQTTAVFASSVTYLIPLVALLWGLMFHESISLFQVVGMGLILVAIWLIRKKKEIRKVEKNEN